LTYLLKQFKLENEPEFSLKKENLMKIPVKNPISFNYSLVIIKSSARATNSSPENTNGIIALIMV